MRTHTFLGALGIGAVVTTFLLGGMRNRPSEALRQAGTLRQAPPAVIGHLILHLEGDVGGLQVTWITAKASGYQKTAWTSPFAAVMFDGAGQQLGSYPIDLSRFDLEPRNLGKPLRVEGCEVWDTRISTIVNVPYLPETVSIELRKGGRVLGKIAGNAYRRMLVAGGEVR